MKPLLITFEGTEGAGKSTLIRKLAERIEGGPQPRAVTITREPGGSLIAEKIRALLLADDMAPLTELFLYEAARAEHLEKTILPALRQGQVVLCDRFTDSSLAYQGHARGLGFDLVRKTNALATRGLTPDFTVFLDVDPAVGLARATEANRFEAEGLAFQRKVRQGFLQAMKIKPSRWIHLKVKDQTPDQLAALVWRKLEKRWR